MKYKLSSAVFFRMYDNCIVLFNTKNQMVYALDSMCEVLLDCFKEYQTIDECVMKLLQKIDISEDMLKKEVTEFVENMVNAGVLIIDNILSEIGNDTERVIKYERIPDNQLVTVQFELTYRCNERCKYCYCVTDKSTEKELTTSEIKKILDELAEMNVLEVVFTGGDLFVRDDAFEILEYANKKRFLISVFTNGLALSDSDLIRLKKLYLKSIHFSIYSADGRIHDEFTQVKGSFKKTVSVIEKCVLLDIPTNIKTTILNINAYNIEDVLELARKLGTTIQVGMSVSARNDGDKSSTDYRLNNEKDYLRVMKIVNENIMLDCHSKSGKKREKNGRVCGAGTRSLNINPYGEVFACNALLISCGNVRKESIKKIWNESRQLKEIKNYRFSQIEGCQNCENMEYCNFCPGSALQENGTPFSKYDEACVLTKAKLELQKFTNSK